jgi:ribonuclease VapC
MILDSSAIVAILLREPEWDQFVEALENDPVRLISSVSALETAMVLESRKRDPGGREFDLFLYRAKISVVPLTEEQYELARQAWRKYGKGNHPAGLNLADCCAYALAKSSGEPLLFKGRDFALTDAEPALKPSN